MGEKPMGTEEDPAAKVAGAQKQAGSPGGATASGGPTAPGARAGVGEPIPGIDVKLGKNPGGA